MLTCRLITACKFLVSQSSNFFKYTDTGFIIDTTPYRVASGLVATSWRAISKLHLLEGLPNPQKLLESSRKDLDKHLTCIIRHYSFQDPPSRKDKVAPLGLITSIRSFIDGSTKATCTVDLITMALYFCLRSCKYSKITYH